MVLLAFAAVAAVAGSRLLARSSWVQRSPPWGIWAWQALTAAVALAIVMAGVTVALPALPVRTHVADLFGTTSFYVAQHYTTPAGAALAAASAVLTAVLLVSVAAQIAVHLHRSARQRRSQVEALVMVGVQHPDGFVVVDHQAPVVYCLPGRRSQVVVSSAALELLTPRELRLVLAHEDTHLRARHDLALSMAAALEKAFLGLRVFSRAHEQIATLVEMQADDSAQASVDRRALARALVTLCSGASPGPALAAGETAALARVRRLTASSASPLRPRQGALVGATTAVLLSTPLVLALAPALEATVTNCWSATHSA
ncbi:M56 family metallopeptidase [Nocardioides sp. PD653]|uniref:M56 family metallopeptidase n=1 Tax=Nocardioides sp. PD653 TaxID=393303 RepID=UPI0009EFB64A|nr:M56 family metallopeptidase [Nocardioides sp. PD653]GAW49788.1 Peptidase family M48 [Nocardioides sp. PD653-B2]GAW56473.1 Peptidase family M48 [Nocardioides sp. PD653]